MKIYQKILINVDSGEIIESINYNYNGPIAHCGSGGGGGGSGKPFYSPAGSIVTSLWGKGGGPLGGALKSVLSPTSTDAYAKLAAQRLTNQTRAGYGARGLANSGISIQGEQDALAGLDAQLAMQKEALVPQVLGTGNLPPSFAPVQQGGSGIFGK